MNGVQNVKAYAFDVLESVGQDSVISGGYGIIVPDESLDALMREDRFLMAAKNLKDRMNAGEQWFEIMSDPQGMTDARTVETFTGKKVGEVITPRISQIMLYPGFYRWTAGLDDADVEQLKRAIAKAREQSHRVSVAAFLERDTTVFPEFAKEDAATVSRNPTIQ